MSVRFINSTRKYPIWSNVHLPWQIDGLFKTKSINLYSRRKYHNMIIVTETAVQKIKALLEGFQYNLAFEGDVGEMDQVIEANGVKVFVDAKSCLYLNGVTLDYSDGLMGAGFKIENPNARSTCGCGESFSA